MFTFSVMILFLLQQQLDAKVPVSDLGSMERLSIEGCHSFSVRSICNALIVDPETAAARAPSLPVKDYLQAIQRRVRFGYQSAGFPDVKVQATLDYLRNRIVLKIDEGPRAKQGQVIIRGAHSIDEAELRRLMNNDVPKSREEILFDLECASKDPPIWKVGEWANCSDDFLQKTHDRVSRLFESLGFPNATISLSMTKAVNSSTCQLVLQIDDEGSSRIGDIKIKGNKRNSREEILSYLDIKPGAPMTRNLRWALQAKLWASGRFFEQKVSFESAPGKKMPANLCIEVVEHPKVNRLSQALPPAQEAAVKFARDISLHDSDTSIEFGDDQGNRFEFVFASHKGIVGRYLSKKNTDPEVTVACFVASPSLLMIGSDSAKTKLELLNPRCFKSIMFSSAITVVKEEFTQEEPRIAIKPQVRSSWERDDLPIEPRINIAPVAMICQVSRLGDHMEWKNGTFISRSEGAEIRLDPKQHELLIQFGEPGKSDGTLRIACANHRFEDVMKLCVDANAKKDNVFDMKKPWNSTLTYLSREAATLHKYLPSEMQEKPWPAEATVTKQLTILAKLFDSYASNETSIPSDGPSFKIPENIDENKRWLPLAYIAAEGFEFGSWPWTIIREAGGCSLGGVSHDCEFERILNRGDSGLFCTFMLAELLETKQHPLDAQLRKKIAKVLTLEQLQFDVYQFTHGPRSAPKFVLPLVEILQNIDDAELKLLQEKVEFQKGFLVFLDLLRKRKNDPPAIALRQAIDEAWPLFLRDEFAQDFQRIYSQKLSKSKSTNPAPAGN